MILLAICDAKYNFIFYDVGQYGSTNDRKMTSIEQDAE